MSTETDTATKMLAGWCAIAALRGWLTAGAMVIDSVAGARREGLAAGSTKLPG
jgi:hypothetical protein